jgi:anion-transporting  ArsA/GET3 family ATPase
LPSSRSATWTARLLDRAGSRVLGLLGRVAGEDFVQDMSGFFAAFGDLFGAFRARGERVGALLRDPRTVFLVVASPDPFRLSEAKEIDRRLTEAGCAARGFVVNQVETSAPPELLDLEASTDQAVSLLKADGERARVRAFIERLEAHRQAHQAEVSIHGEAVAALRDYAAPRPVFVAPRVPVGRSARTALLAIYVGLFSDEGAGSD